MFLKNFYLEKMLVVNFFLPEISFGGRKVNIFGGTNLLPGSVLTQKRVGAHCATPSKFTQFFGLNAIVTDVYSICKFLNIRCGRFDIVLRLI